MTTDMIFAPLLPQKLPSSFQCDHAGSASSDPSSKTASPDSSKDAKHETFLSTLRKVSRDRSRSEESRKPASTSADRSKKSNRQPEDEPGIDNAPGDDDALNKILSSPGDDAAALNTESQLTADLNRLIAWLEQLGLKAPPGEGRVPRPA